MRFWAVILALALSLPAQGEEDQGSMSYHVFLTDLDNSDLEQKIQTESVLLSRQDAPVSGLVALQRRADEDHDRIDGVLRAEGYYQATIQVDIDAKAQPVNVVLRIQTGPVFRLEAFNLHMNGEAPPPSLERLGVELGEPGRAEEIVKAEKKLLEILAEDGYPLARIRERNVVVDHDDDSMRVGVTVDTGALAHFGPVTISGLVSLPESWLRNRIPWSVGDQFSVSAMERLRKRLNDSRLFSSVRLTTAPQVRDDGLLPISIVVTEGLHRSVGLGGSWSMTEGFGGQAFWETRNLLEGAERLRAQITASEIRNAIDLTYDGPDFLKPDQDLIGAAKIEELRTKAYVTRTEGGSAGLSWLLTETLRASASGAFEHTSDVEQSQLRTYSLMSVPMDLRYDGSDDLLDPKTGERVTVMVQPFLNVLGGQGGFNRFELLASSYLHVWDSPSLVLANWGRVGTIQGAGTFDVPAPHRFFVGGAGSVRGFGLQKAGPLDGEGDPIGGLSALSFGSEFRIKVTESIGVGPFAEGGRAYQDSFPSFDQALFWGAGLGLRWYTPVGPVRADLAFPLNPRPGVDSRTQIYLSLGQAF